MNHKYVEHGILLRSNPEGHLTLFVHDPAGNPKNDDYYFALGILRDDVAEWDKKIADIIRDNADLIADGIADAWLDQPEKQ